MKFTRRLNELNKTDADIAGGKGSSLGEMLQAGIPVPPGFVVLSVAFETFLAEADLDAVIKLFLDSTDAEDSLAVNLVSEKIQSAILEAKVPQDILKEIEKQFADLGISHVAVRSSATAEDTATASWAGQLDSFLNVTEQDLLVSVQKCWASLYTPRAITYRFEKRMQYENIGVAVVVQKMVKSEMSGVAFSVHPVTNNANQLIIEAGIGLGEALVSGFVTPDSYIVGKQPLEITDVTIQKEESVLSNTQIIELSSLVINIENHYGFPCDVEWTFEDGVFYIVQSRPITTFT